jgi:CRISPR type III-A-associated RAMP protein Csm4
MFPGIPNHAFLVRFRPTGPWRFGAGSDTRDRLELVYHSDAAFSAVTAAMASLGYIDEWLDATARAQGVPAVRFSSFFPFQGDALLVIPPRSHWPPPDSAKVRYKAARFVPLSVVNTLLDGGEIDENKWAVDGESECLVPERSAQQGPFRTVIRSNAAVDRLEPGKVAGHATACLEFARDAGLWTLVVFADDVALAHWEERVRAAFRLLADSGFGGGRSRGWGRSEMPGWQPLNPRVERKPEPAAAEESDVQLETTPADPVPPSHQAYWLLSVFTPAATDQIDWTRGNYSTLTRSGRIESAAGWGQLKQPTLMLAEGSVLVCESKPQGAARDTAPQGFPHPVFRAGYAVALPVKARTA